MANFAGQRVTFSRFLGYMDEDDPTNLPSGVASLARNCDFTYTSVRTRAGNNKTMQAVYQSPISGLMGLIYTPENDTDAGFQLPILAQLRGQGGHGTMQYESPVGTGRMREFLYTTLFTPPQDAHMLGSQAYNRAYTSWSNLLAPLSRCSVLDLKTKNIDPYGQKPFGWAWIANTAVLVGEMVGPSTIEDGVTVAAPNGHTYRVITAGVTGAAQPAWPTTEGAIFTDGTAQLQELTMVLANRIPQPAAPAIARHAGVGTFAAGRDVYLVLTLLNPKGETVASLPAVLVNTLLNDAVDVTIPTLASMAGWIQGLLAGPYGVTGANVYEADVATGTAAPPLTEYQQVAGGPFALGTTLTVTDTAASGILPPARNSARITPGMVPNPTAAPAVSRITGAGTFPMGRDVYIRTTYTNDAGETMAGPASSIINTQLNDEVQVLVEGLTGYTLAGVDLYEADVPTGANEPNETEFARVGSYQPGQTASITTTAFGPPPPTTNTTGAGGNIAADTDAGGPNGTQGYRYAVPAFKNRNGSISGITENAIVRYIVDENGWELAAFNVAPGPLNVAARVLGFSIADATDAGPFGFMAKSAILGGIQVLQTVIDDNITTKTLVNFTDDQLDGAIADGDSLTDYLDTIWPYPCVDLYYSPSLNRFFQTGVPGFASSHLVSQAGDAETYQGSTCEVKVGQDDGERCICVREFTNGTIFSLRERSGFILTPSGANPQNWNAQRQWSKVGPCGPRAVDVAGNFLAFIHRSGIYRYERDEPELISKENPYWWKTINWAAEETIWCVIDVEKRVVRCGFPTGNSKVPNLEYAIHYVEGWAYPIHFSTYSGKMIAVDACRKVSTNDVAAFCAARIERTLPPPANPPQGVDGLDTLGGDFYQSQFVYGSSAADGAVHAITPGTYNDNGAGIDWHYRTVSAGVMQSLVKPEGFNLNARGNGLINATFLSGRDMRTDWTPEAATTRQLKVRPFDLSPNQSAGISRMVESRVNEHWTLEFDNGNQPDVWAELKYLDVYLIPMYSAREAGER